MSEKRSNEKIACFEEWMKGDHVMVHLDSRREGVSVPPMHEGNPSLTLQLSYAFRGETTHDHQEIHSFLKFQGEYFECILPWQSIWGFTSAEGESKLWPQDMPKELIVKMAQSKLQAVGKKLFGKEPKTTDDSSTSESNTRKSNPSSRKAQKKSASYLKPVPKAELKSTAGQSSDSSDEQASASTPATDSQNQQSETPGEEKQPGGKRNPQLKRVK